MAHGDYDCCAICDSKQAYNSVDAETKEEICTGCLVNLRAQGLSILTVDKLLDWMKSEDKEKVKEILKNIGFSKCFYPNRVDKHYQETVGATDR